MKQTTLAIMLSIFFLIPSHSSANLRAPYHKDFHAGGDISSSEKLVVNTTRLFFDFEHYYHGKIQEVMNTQQYTCRVKAVYMVHSVKTTDVVFTFVSPSQDSFLAKINTIPVTSSVSSKSFVVIEPRFNRKKNKLFTYNLTFQGRINKGSNKIEVTYLQPISAREYNYGYFTSGSNWKSFVEYHYWPIKEWEKAATFSTEIMVSVPYEWGIFDYLNGPDITINLFLLTAKGGNIVFKKPEAQPAAGTPVMIGKRLTRKFIITNIFPDILRIQINDN